MTKQINKNTNNEAQALAAQAAVAQAVSELLTAATQSGKAHHTAVESALRKLVKSGGQAQAGTVAFSKWYNKQRKTQSHKALGQLTDSMCPAITYDRDTNKMVVAKKGASFVWTYNPEWHIKLWDTLPANRAKPVPHIKIESVLELAQAHRAKQYDQTVKAAKRTYQQLAPVAQTDANVVAIADMFLLTSPDHLRDALTPAKK